MRIREIDNSESLSGAYSFNSAIINADICDMIGIQANVTVDTPAAITVAYTDVDVDANTITKTAHGFTLGLKVQVTTDDTLPTGISALTDYFVIVVDADTIKLATSLVNAQAGTAVNITAQGAGNHTLTAVALAGCTVRLYHSNDGVTFFAANDAQNITTTASFWLEKDRPIAHYYRVTYTITAGHISVEQLNLCSYGR